MPEAVEAMEAYSELRTSKAIKESSSIHKKCLTMGEEEANQYVTSINFTTENLSNGKRLLLSQMFVWF